MYFGALLVSGTTFLPIRQAFMVNRASIMFKMKKSFGNLSLQELEKFLSDSQIVRVPEDYRKFLLDSNGGVPLNTLFNIPDLKRVGVILRFYGVGHSLGLAFRSSQARFPEQVFPIGGDAFGNLILLSFETNCVYFWQHDADTQITLDHSWDNIFKLSNTFSEFFESLSFNPDDAVKDEAPIKKVIKGGDVDALERLLKRGLSPDAKDENGLSLVALCAEYRNSQMIRLLHSFGANLKPAQQIAFENKDEDLCIFLLEALGNSDEKLKILGTWLHVAAKNNLPIVAKYLIEKGCHVNVQDRKGNTPLRYSYLDSEKGELTKILVESGGRAMYSWGEARDYKDNGIDIDNRKFDL